MKRLTIALAAALLVGCAETKKSQQANSGSARSASNAQAQQEVQKNTNEFLEFVLRHTRAFRESPPGNKLAIDDRSRNLVEEGKKFKGRQVQVEGTVLAVDRQGVSFSNLFRVLGEEDADLKRREGTVSISKIGDDKNGPMIVPIKPNQVESASSLGRGSKVNIRLIVNTFQAGQQAPVAVIVEQEVHFAPP